MAIDPRPLTLLLGRFEDLVARGLRSLVADDPTIDVLARDVAPEVFADAIAEHKPGVAVVNFGSLTSPFEVHELATRYPDTHLIVLANRPTQVECTQLLAFGATACLSKETQGRDILNAIHLASRGMQLLPRSARMSTAALAGPELLTAREADVLALLQSGSSNAQIAGELHVSVETVRTHARNIYRKLGVRTRRELAHR